MTRHWPSTEALKYWGPQVDWYNGGMEHTTLHLLYSRFWHKFLYDIGVVPTKEPYHKRTSHGMILGEGGEKMSKARGNVVNPNDIVAQYGADTMRLHIMFIGATKAPALSAARSPRLRARTATSVTIKCTKKPENIGSQASLYLSCQVPQYVGALRQGQQTPVYAQALAQSDFSMQGVTVVQQDEPCPRHPGGT